MTRTRIAILIVVVLLLVGNVYFGWRYVSTVQALQKTDAELAKKQQNEQVVQFTNFFIEKVLKAQGEVDFDTRLKLENDVRQLNDPQILADWEAFTNSKTELEAQGAVKTLLGDLVAKISTQ